jgi:putative addiction module component (TIGR02574 family)
MRPQDATPDPELEELLRRAWTARRAAFADEVSFSAPSFKHFRSSELETSGEPRFVAVSVTGAACELGCEHCRGTLLQPMIPASDPGALLDLAARLRSRGCRGILLSGGCDLAGSVPIEPFLDAVRQIRASLGLDVAVHVGLADSGLAHALAAAGVDRVMVDLAGDTGTIRDVLHLDVGPDRFEASLATLVAEGLAVVPHVVAGLHRGRILGEERALEMAARHDVSAVALVVVRPGPGTGFRDIEPPGAGTMGRLMAHARLLLPSTPLVLGCARPVGTASRELELLALRAGFNGVAFPADATVVAARRLGLQPLFAERCCAFAPSSESRASVPDERLWSAERVPDILSCMTITVLQDEALKLPAEERAALIDVLWSSLDSPDQDFIDHAWAEESEGRIQAWHEGSIQSVEGPAAMAELKQRFSR